MEQYIMPQNSNKPISIINIILIIVIVLLVLVLLSLLFIWSPMTVVGDSMVNTFHDGDHIFLVKFGYHITYGDIVIFYKNDVSNKKIIKRVIGLPGDYIRYYTEEKAWYRNDEKLNEPYVSVQYISTYILSTTDLELSAALSSKTGLLVEENQLFVLGDNRNTSNDSHIYGCISRDSLVGKYLFSY